MQSDCSPLSTKLYSLLSNSLCLALRRFSNQTAKQRDQRDFVVPGSSPMPRAVSFEDFRKHRDLHLSSKRSVDSSNNIQKAKSESDVAMLSLKKKVEVSWGWGG